MSNKKETITAIGNKVLIRTVTMYFVGEIVGTEDVAGVTHLRLTKSSWVADTGRFHKALMSGALSEVEYNKDNTDRLVNPNTNVDVVPWDHDLPNQTI